MKLKDLGEFGLIDRLSSRIKGTSPNVIVGPGDDAAVISSSKGKLTVATTDMMVEGVHFDLRYCSYFSVGWKSLCSNISDCVAMGGNARQALISIGLPKDTNVEDVDELYDGIFSLAEKFNVDIIGGDTVSSNILILNIALLGEVKKRDMLLRSSAKPGDVILVTGEFGVSQAGLEIFQHKKGKRSAGFEHGSLLKKHMLPEPRVAEGRAIAVSGLANAMMDSSDGLAKSVAEICRMSGVGAVVDADAIPVSIATKMHARMLKEKITDLALYGGEDYELVFTAPARKAEALKKLVEKKTGTPVTIVGNIVNKSNGVKVKGHSCGTVKLLDKGYDHFRRTK